MASQVKQRKRELRRQRDEGTNQKRPVHEGQPGGQDRRQEGRPQGNAAPAALSELTYGELRTYAASLGVKAVGKRKAIEAAIRRKVKP